MPKLKEQSICQENTYDKIYREQADQLFRWLYYKCKDEGQASDLVQDAFVKLWENCKKVSLDKAKSFLFTVASNQFLNSTKRKKYHTRFLKSQNVHHDHETPDFILQQSEFEERLQLAISNLPEKQREVFLMNRIDQLKYREIAELLGLSQKAVEKRMHLALVSLKEILKGNYE